MHTIYLVVISMRPRQWVKNLLVYVAFLFTIDVKWDLHSPSEAVVLLSQCTLAFVVFCLASGAVYLVNDWADRYQDQKHPRKRHRPIAAGLLGPTTAVVLAILFGMVALLASFLLGAGFGGIMSLYLLMMLGYSFLLKRLVIVDVLILGVGFVLRAAAGAVIMSAPISPWLYAVTGLGALFVGFGKRRSELVNSKGRVGTHRDTLKQYTPELLDQLISITASSFLLVYMLYTFTASNLPANNSMMLTIPCVVYGLFRYLYLIRNGDIAERPEDAMLTDKPLLTTLGIWFLTAALVLLAFNR